MILHSSYFIPNFAKAWLSHRQTLALSALKTMFHRIKHDLSHDETWSLAQRNGTFGKSILCKPTDYRLTSV